MSTALAYQNCGNKVLSFSSNTVSEKYGSIDCVSFDNSTGSTNCANSRYGLIGNLYYLLDKTAGTTIPASLYDKNDTALAFNGSVLNSVNVVIDRGYASSTYILMPNVSVPAIAFNSGFQLDDGSYLRDNNNKILIEGFALDLNGSLQLAPDMEEGRYEIAVLSDDGSLLDMDLNNDGELENIVDNDGYHPPKLKCSNSVIDLSQTKKIPMRLRYYQGPRTTIALTLVMRKLLTSELPGMDSDCDFTDTSGDYWFGASTTSQGYAPNYTTSRFGQLLGRGWFIPEKTMFALPDSL